MQSSASRHRSTIAAIIEGFEVLSCKSGISGEPEPKSQSQEDGFWLFYCLESEMENGDMSCAWCNQEQNIPQGEGSHGICEEHREREELKYQQDRFDRIPSYVERFKKKREEW